MRTFIKNLLIVIVASFSFLSAQAVEDWESWETYDFYSYEVDETQLYCYLDLVEFGRWENGQMVGCVPVKGEYVYLIFSVWIQGQVKFYWRNTGDGDWDDKYKLKNSRELVYSMRKRPGDKDDKEISGGMKILRAYSIPREGRYLITLDNHGIARKFKFVLTPDKR